MIASVGPSVHATAVLVGERALLIRGPSGAGKSRLALELYLAESGALPFVRLVADDRCLLTAAGERLIVRPAPGLEGLIEVRGLGIRQVPFVAAAVVGTVIDLGADAQRLPESDSVVLSGIRMPRLAVTNMFPPLPLVLAHCGTASHCQPAAA